MCQNVLATFYSNRKNVCSLVDGKSTKYSIHRHFVLGPGKTGNISFMLKLTLLLRSKVIPPKVGVIHKQCFRCLGWGLLF